MKTNEQIKAELFDVTVTDALTLDKIVEAALQPVKYQFGTKYRGSSQVYIEWRGDDLWAITNGGSCLNTDFQWEIERLPSGRTDEFLKRNRFTFEGAKAHLTEAVRRGEL